MSNKLNITFVRPPFEGMTDYCPPHMGIACLYGYLDKSFGGHICCTLVDALSGRWSLEQVIQMIEDTFPDVICITAKTMQVEQTIELLEFFRRTSCILICGGNHVSVEPDIFIESGANFAIVGEGEKPLRTIIKCLLDNDMEKIEEDNRIIYDKNELSKISIRKKFLFLIMLKILGKPMSS